MNTTIHSTLGPLLACMFYRVIEDKLMGLLLSQVETADIEQDDGANVICRASVFITHLEFQNIL